MVLIRSISPTTFLHLSTRGESFCLRDYSASPTAPPVEVIRQDPDEGVTTSTIEAEARRAGNMLIPAPSGADKDDSAFWHKHVMELNRRHLRAAPPTPPVPTSPPVPPASLGMSVGIAIEIRNAGVLVGTLRTSRNGLVWLPRGRASGHRLTWSEFERLVAAHGSPVGVAEEA
jgi:hypothetical protein